MKVALLQGKKSTQIVFNYNSIVKDTIKTVKGWHYDVVCKKWSQRQNGRDRNKT